MAKDKRNYNVFLNVHTVSGIIITIGLFICFFAGGIALFYKNINNWEKNLVQKTVGHNAYNIDYEKALETVKKSGYTMQDRNFDFAIKTIEKKDYLSVSSRVGSPRGRRPEAGKSKNKKNEVKNVTKKNDKSLNSLQNTSKQKLKESDKNNSQNLELKKKKAEESFNPKGNIAMILDLNTYQPLKDIKNENGERRKHGKPQELGTFIYHLHYFDQLPTVGVYISGVLSLFFLVALITGVIVHWKKLIENFFTFRLKNSIKLLWTDAHTALGVIGLPFQFIFAVTGSFFGLASLFIILNTLVIYEGDQQKLIAAVAPAFINVEKAGEPLKSKESLNLLALKANDELHLNNHYTLTAKILNYNDKNGRFILNYRDNVGKNFYGNAYIMYNLSNGSIVSKKVIDSQGWDFATSLETMRKLHFGTYGGYFLRLVYFLLSLLTCFVILSGVMIWLEVRNNKKYAKKLKFNRNVGAIFIGNCMGLFPAIAYFFCLAKIIPQSPDRFGIMEQSFYMFWFGFTLYSYWVKDLHTINKHALFMAGVLGISVPICNGISTANWFWLSLNRGLIDSFFVDLAWLITGIISLSISLFAKRLVSKRKKKAPQTRKPITQPQEEITLIINN
ncbi:PepSY domain-containing protein [Formosa sediminum]|uniref:PepSY domain-containing protein n=1 Tax=Formosa sediminum TaxID=2594004 RepID=A0A516GM27_9FLAO|nr:PepSY-associated TM helix domain-containing protein [Formosa sediminum]QDO92573.1 PepSY domain-containing protein [Formosa sediminum]